MGAEDRVRELGLDLAQAAAPVANYVPAVAAGNLLFLSGQLPANADGGRPDGKVGIDFPVEEAYQMARQTATGLLARLRAEIGNLDRVKRVVKVTGYVNAPPDFKQHPQVVNGASDLFVEVFGDRGKHARAAVGVASLPFGAPLEIEMIVEIEGNV